jgi:hypothetical protein
VAQVVPRRHFDEVAIDCGSTTRVRLGFASDVELRFAGRLMRSTEQPTVQWATLDAARDARAGDVKDLVLAADGTTATITGPDTLNASFTLPPLAAGRSRDCFLWVHGTVAAGKAAGSESSVLTGDTVPTEFALFQNRPNPFRATTAIRFALPRASVVRLEVFDVQGRRVATPASAYFPAGYHVVPWDHRSEAGAHVGAGVYHYRMQAGSFRVKKKMVLLP